MPWELVAPKRTDRDKEQDRVDIAALYVKGKSIREISKWIGENRHYTLSRHQVCEDLKAIRQDWREQTQQSMDEWTDAQLAKLDRVEAEAWDAWDRSKLEAMKTRQSKGTDGTTTATVEKEGQTGDPRYLSAVLTVIERRSKLLGLDAPERRELSGPDGGPIQTAAAKIDEAHIDAILREHYGGRN